MFSQTESNPVGLSATATIPELQQSKTAVLNTLASKHSRRSYEYAIERFIAWYCSEPRLTFNRSVVVRYRSFLERLSLSAATINLHLSAIRRLADESAESGWLSPELAIGIRRVKGVKRLRRKMGNWLTRNQAQELVNAASKTNLRGRRDGAMVGLLLGCGLRRSEVVGLNLDQLQSREGRWVIVNLVGKGARLRTVPVPSWSKELVDAWLRHSGVTDGKVFRQVLKGGMVQPSGVTANVVWYAAKRCAGQAGINNLAPHDLRRTCARLCHGSGGELEQIQFLLGHASVQTTERYIGSKQKLQDAVMIDSGSRSQVRPLESFKRSRFGLLAIASFIATYPTSRIMSQNAWSPSSEPTRASARRAQRDGLPPTGNGQHGSEANGAGSAVDGTWRPASVET